jgi:molecular chaperone Hsp33
MSRPSSHVRVRRHILRDDNAVLAVGDFSDLFEAYAAHVRRWELPLDPLGEVIMRQMLAGAALQMSFRVPEERSAWTLNLKKPPLNAFVAGGGRADTLTGRYFVEGVETSEDSRLFVERSHPKHRPSRSMLTVEGLDALVVYEQLYERSEQIPARFLELEETRMAMVQGLPRSERDWVQGLDREEVGTILDEDLETIETRDFRFHCGCDGDRMARALVRFFRHDPEKLFAGEEGAETSCPRCGARWYIDRELFERTAAAHPDLGASG